MKTAEITLTCGQKCYHCRAELPEGETVIAEFKRDKRGLYTGVESKFFCDEFCLIDYREKRAKPVDRLLNRRSVQFN